MFKIVWPKFNLLQFNSVALSCPTLCDPWTAVYQASFSIINSWSLLKLMSIQSVMPSNHLTLCCPFLLPPSIFPSIRVFSNSQFFTSGGQSTGASASAGLISFTIDWFDLAIQGTFKSLLQHHTSKASILWHSAL